jgi:sulfate/thiosulfate transport system ATP-binding protein
MSIILTDLVKRFDNTLVVNKVSLEIQDGELFVLLGASGSGKSTILRMVAGLTEPDSGRIELNGRDVTNLTPQVRNTGFVFQNYSLFRHMNALQNVEFGLLIRRVPAAERRRKAEELLDMVGLAGLGERHAEQLSGGQQQRIALARALAYEPSVLLLDEPFGALDVKIRAQLRETLKNIQRQLRLTTILVTHDQEEAFELADRIGLLDHGHLVEVNTPETLYHRPSTEFAATFVGGGNVLVGQMDGDRIRLGTVTLPLYQGAPVHDTGAPVRVLFRPESVLVQPDPFGPDSSVHVLGEGQVLGRTFAGPLQRVRLAFAGLEGIQSSTEPDGDRTTQIDAAMPGVPELSAVLASSKTLWAGVRSYHILAPTGLKVLICADQTPVGEAAAEFGCRLAQALRGPATLLGIASSARAVSAVRDQLEAMRAKWPEGQNPHLQIRVRQGNTSREILFEAQEGYYELIVMGSASTTGSTVRLVLEQTRIPVLLVQAPRPDVKRILICTAAGEPGKADVRFGGRIARRTGARVTLLHVRQPDSSAQERRWVERHLQQLRASLAATGVNCEVKIEEGRVAAHILQEAEAGDYDLIILGASLPRGRQFRPWAGSRTNQLVRRIKRPVVVVPIPD